MVSAAASERQGPGFNSGLGSLSVWSLHVLPVFAWVSSGCSGFLPQSKGDVEMRRWTGVNTVRVLTPPDLRREQSQSSDEGAALQKLMAFATK